METIYKLHGNPKTIVSDIDPIFTRKFWTKLFSFFCTYLAHSSSYHTQPDGNIEIVNKCLKGYICYFSSNKQKWCNNTSFHTSSKMSLFMSPYGYHTPYITSPLKGNS